MSNDVWVLNRIILETLWIIVLKDPLLDMYVVNRWLLYKAGVHVTSRT